MKNDLSAYTPGTQYKLSCGQEIMLHLQHYIPALPSSPAFLTSWLFLEKTKHAQTSGTLHMLLILPGIPFLWHILHILESDLKCHLLRKTFPDFPILSRHSYYKNSQHLLSPLIAFITIYHMYAYLLISIIHRNICLIATSSFLNMQARRSGSVTSNQLHSGSPVASKNIPGTEKIINKCLLSEYSRVYHP